MKFCHYFKCLVLMDLNAGRIIASSLERSGARSSVAHRQAVPFVWAPRSAPMGVGEMSVLGLPRIIRLQLSVPRTLFFIIVLPHLLQLGL